MKGYRTKLAVTGFAATTAAILAGASPVHRTGYELVRYTVDSGGGMRTIGGAFELSGTVGQPEVGKPMEGDGFELTGGFWFRLYPGDCNDDGCINLFDYGDFEGCMVGPSVRPGETPCPCLDLNRDSDVDLADLAEFQRGFGG